MSKHKWYKEIKAFLDGEIVLCKTLNKDFIQMEGVVKKLSAFDNDECMFRIMPKQKECECLYVYKDSGYTMETCNNEENVIIKRKRIPELEHEFIATIKLEKNHEFSI